MSICGYLCLAGCEMARISSRVSCVCCFVYMSLTSEESWEQLKYSTLLLHL